MKRGIALVKRPAYKTVMCPQAAMQIGNLMQQMDRQEPKNAYLYDEYAKVFCRIVCHFLVSHLPCFTIKFYWNFYHYSVAEYQK